MWKIFRLFLFIVLFVNWNIGKKILNELEDEIKETENELKILDELINLQKQKLEKLWKLKNLSSGESKNLSSGESENLSFGESENLSSGESESQTIKKTKIEPQKIKEEKTEEIIPSKQQPSNTKPKIESVPIHPSPNSIPKDPFFNIRRTGFVDFKKEFNDTIHSVLTFYFKPLNKYYAAVSITNSLCIFTKDGKRLVCIGTDKENFIKKIGATFKNNEDVVLVCQNLKNEIHLYIFHISVEGKEEYYSLSHSHQIVLNLPAVSLETNTIPNIIPKVIVGDFSGNINLYTIEGELKFNTMLEFGPISLLSRKGRRLAYLHDQTIGFFDLALMKKSPVRCECTSLISEIGFDLSNNNNLLYAITNGTILFFDTLATRSTQATSECFLRSEISISPQHTIVSFAPSHLIMVNSEYFQIFNSTEKSIPILALQIPLSKFFRNSEGSETSLFLHMTKNFGVFSSGSEIQFFEIPLLGENELVESIISWLFHPMIFIFVILFFIWRMYSSITKKQIERKPRTKVS